jgi:hypothetical protein
MSETRPETWAAEVLARHQSDNFRRFEDQDVCEDCKYAYPCDASVGARTVLALLKERDALVAALRVARARLDSIAIMGDGPDRWREIQRWAARGRTDCDAALAGEASHG